tara:strand:+ start:2116 stop:2901 length:786 start_codon:yes stop_codon:yes gene_type:complete
MRSRSAIFLNKDEACEYFVAHHSLYINSLSKEERRIKGIDINGSCYDIGRKIISEFSIAEKKMIRNRLPPDQFDIPWFFIKVSINYENGYPHTINGAIVLSEGDVSSTVLRHERVHVLQKQYSEWFDSYYSNLYGVDRLSNIKIPSELKMRVRSNPDTPDLNYGLRVRSVSSTISHIIPLCLYEKDLIGVKSMSETIIVGYCIPTNQVYPIDAFKLWHDNGGPKEMKKAEHIHEWVAYNWEDGFPNLIYKKWKNYYKNNKV